MPEKKSLLLVSMPFAETSVPSIQLGLLESYLKNRDIDVSTRHLYLKAADFIGLNNYNFLINSPNDSYIAQMVFSKYVFSDHWKKNLRKFKYFYENIVSYKKDFSKKFSFESYVKQNDRFIEWAEENISWEKFDIIGFTLNYGQFLPSLTLAKKIKEKNPEKIIVLGGSTPINELGEKILSIFKYVDFVVSGEGEEALFLLTNDFENYKKIPGLIYRRDEHIISNKNTDYIDMNNLPYPSFQSYYNEFNYVSNEIIQYHQLYGKIPIELSRGCWWNNCTFCNVSAYHKKYREKDYNRFTEEIKYLSDTYKILNFQVIGSTLPQRNYKDLCEKIIDLNRDFTLYIEARAGALKSKDYNLLRKAGFTHIQTGVESFSSKLLKKMNKGVKVIDNIAALKFCKENHIKNSYNIIINYPNEDKNDFEESKKTIKLLQKYIEPANISKYVVGYQSPIYNNLKKFNIKDIKPKIIDTIMYPKEILDKKICFFYSFKRKNKIKENPWKELVSKWKETYEEQQILGLKRNTALDKLVFYYKDGGEFIKIYDKRYEKNAMIYILNEIEREVFLACDDVISKTELKEKNKDISQAELEKILNSFVESGIVYREDESYLSLPISYNKFYNKKKKQKTIKKLELA